MQSTIKKANKILSTLLVFCFLFQQAGFAQVAVELNLANYLSRVGANLAVDKFRPLHLRYFSYDNQSNEFKLFLDKGDLKNPKQQDLQGQSQELLKYFLIGVTLPDEAFWVNLRPDAESNIIDAQLARTDIGKILLESDLQLKKDTALYTSPENPLGKEYWEKLYKKAAQLYGTENITIPTLTRPWIVPNEIILRQGNGSAYIYKATLKVMLEADYLKAQTNKTNLTDSSYSFSDPRAKALNEYSTQLIKELIIPKLNQEVNSSKKYSNLRQVYYSLILARWFKTNFYGKGGTYSSLINKSDLTNLTSQAPWSKTTYFNAYKESFSKGEYNLQVPVSGLTGQSIRSYFSGGIKLLGSSPAGFTGSTTPERFREALRGGNQFTGLSFKVDSGGKGINPFLSAAFAALSRVPIESEEDLESENPEASSPADENARGLAEKFLAERADKLTKQYNRLLSNKLTLGLTSRWLLTLEISDWLKGLGLGRDVPSEYEIGAYISPRGSTGAVPELYSVLRMKRPAASEAKRAIIYLYGELKKLLPEYGFELVVDDTGEYLKLEDGRNRGGLYDRVSISMQKDGSFVIVEENGSLREKVTETFNPKNGLIVSKMGPSTKDDGTPVKFLENSELVGFYIDSVSPSIDNYFVVDALTVERFGGENNLPPGVISLDFAAKWQMSHPSKSLYIDFSDALLVKDGKVAAEGGSSPAVALEFSDARVSFEGIPLTKNQLDRVLTAPNVGLAEEYSSAGEAYTFTDPSVAGRRAARFGYKANDGALRMETRQGIVDWARQAKSNGAKMMIHIGIGGQGMSNQEELEYWGDLGTSVFVIGDKLGWSMNKFFDHLMKVLGYKASEITISASSKSGATIEPLIAYQQSVSEFCRRLGQELGYADQARDLGERFFNYLKQFNQGKKGGDLFKGIDVSDFNAKFDAADREILKGVLQRMVFTTTPNVDASRLFAFAQGMKEIFNDVNIAIFDFDEFTGGRYTKYCESGSVTQAFSGLPIVELTSFLQGQAKHYLGKEGNDPKKNSAYMAAVITRKINPKAIVVAVRSSNALSEALQKQQLFTESDGKDGQGSWVVVAVGQEELNYKVNELKKQTGEAPLVIMVDFDQNNYPDLKSLALKGQAAEGTPVIRFVKDQISPFANAAFALWFQEFTVRYGLLSEADMALEHGLKLEIPDVGASAMNMPFLADGKPNFWYIRDPQNQYLVQLAKTVLDIALDQFDASGGKSDQAIQKRYQEQEERVNTGEYIIQEQINFANDAGTANLTAAEIASQGLLDARAINNAAAVVAKKVTKVSDTSDVAKALMLIRDLMEIRSSLAAKQKTASLIKDYKRAQKIQIAIEQSDNQIDQIYRSIGTYGILELAKKEEAAARILAGILLTASRRQKIVSSLFYTHSTEADILGKFLRLMDFGIGTRDQHATGEHRAGGRRVVANILVDFVKSYEAVAATQDKIISFGLVQNNADGMYPDELRRLFLQAVYKVLTG